MVFTFGEVKEQRDALRETGNLLAALMLNELLRRMAVEDAIAQVSSSHDCELTMAQRAFWKGDNRAL